MGAFYDVGGALAGGTRGYRQAKQDIRADKRFEREGEQIDRRAGMEDERMDMARSQEGRAQDTHKQQKAKWDETMAKMKRDGSLATRQDAYRKLKTGNMKAAAAALNSVRGEDEQEITKIQYDEQADLRIITRADGTKEVVKGAMIEGMLFGLGKKSSAAGKAPAEVQTIEWYAANLTKGDKKRAYKLYKMASESPEKAYAKIYGELVKANKNKFGEDKLSSAEMHDITNKAVKHAGEQRDELLNIKKKEKPQAMPETPTSGAINRTPQGKDPLGIL